jgi:hypothetical protein
MRDIFALQDEIVRRIVTTSNLQLNLSQQGSIMIPRSTENLEAYDYLLRGWEYHIAVTRDGNAKARQMFEKALAASRYSPISSVECPLSRMQNPNDNAQAHCLCARVEGSRWSVIATV